MRRYLLVDDNQALAENLADIVGSAGAEVEWVVTGAEAIARVQRQRFDALLTDMRMPVMDGAELIHRVRRLDPGLPVLVFTAHSGDSDLRIARREGLLGVLFKPVPILRLLELLAVARRDGMVALVEDDEELCDNLTEALATRGFTAVAAHSVLETERLGQLRPFSAVVDLVVPGGPFGEGLRRMQAQFPKLPILVMTAHADLGQPPPPFTTFHKPFSTEALLDALEDLHGPLGPLATPESA